ncbi:MAG: family 20 glycosylhydrolase [Bacteroidales bacterium]|nr:family 20 glycosylhydrolase [Bacteroidales bacterium]
MKGLLIIILAAYVGVIPQPVSMEVQEGSINACKFNTVYRLNKDAAIPAEGYTIDATGKKVIVEASTEAGLFYAKQTINQLKQGRRIPKVRIVDYPRFEWRGWHIDPCRHFMEVKDIKKQIDVMAQYKINTLHWHLTDDQGWRIEIKKYPRLTEVGGWRTEFDGSVHGGFYTQDEIRDVVKYAAERHITVVPEIEMPGHSAAAIKAYPELCCTKEKMNDFYTWGSPDIVLCAGQDFTYEFLENVIAEVVELFPSEYIHIGGDECQKTKWKNCPVCQARIKSEGLKADSEFTAEEKLQSYAVRRMEKILAKYGRKLIGWDEILEGGLSDGAAVMSWRGESGGIKAAKTNHTVVMTPSRAGMYFDHYQGDAKIEPVTIGNLNTLEKVYNYDPVPAALTQQGKGSYVKGVQCNNWSEYMYDEAKREYMLFPRAFALAEIAWTQLENKNFSDFLVRMDEACKRLDKAGVVYHIPLPEQPGGSCDKLAFIGETAVEFTTSRPMKMVYTLDGSEPTIDSKEYTEPLKFTESGLIKIACVTNYGKLGPVRTITVTKQQPLKATPAPEAWKGLVAQRADGRFTSRNQLTDELGWKPVKVDGLKGLGALEKFDKNMPDSLKFYATKAEGWISVPKTGVYRFSSDIDLVVIDGQTVIDNDGEVKRYSRRDCEIALEKGLHKIDVIYIYNVVGGWNSLRYKPDVLVRRDGEEKFKSITIY